MNFLNVIVESDHVLDTDRGSLFPDSEDVLIIRPGNNKDMFDLLVLLGAFPSRSQARKNWKGTQAIPEGWSEFFVGKKKRHLCCWRPSW